jgi:cysteine desulfurase/selenocysteine lyase
MGGSTHSTAPRTSGHLALDVAKIRKDFPILHQEVYGKPLVYLDNAATTQKPQAVIDALVRYYTFDNANIHRGVHALSMRATESYENAREKVRAFLGASERDEIVFVRGATEGINLVARTYGAANVGEGDEIIISNLEHHSNIVPWQILCDEKKARLRVAPMDDRGDLLIDQYRTLFNARTKLAAFSYVSNAIGTVNPAEEMISIAHRHKVPVLIDAAQAAPHLKIDVRALDCEFLVFSGHKVYGPTGAGALYVKRPILEAMPPYQAGGDMIAMVTFAKTTYNKIPHRFEAGTPHIAGVIGLGAALDYVTGLGFERITAHEDDVVQYAVDEIGAMDGITLIGRPRRRAGAVSFMIDGVHPHDAGTILDREGIAVRAGHHCSQPVMDFFHVPATVRASFGVYNTRDDVDRLVAGIKRVREVFA